MSEQDSKAEVKKNDHINLKVVGQVNEETKKNNFKKYPTNMQQN